MNNSMLTVVPGSTPCALASPAMWWFRATRPGTSCARPGTSPPTSSLLPSPCPSPPQDVVEVVNYARTNGLRVAGQGTGHGAGPIARSRAPCW